jgi:hypothetical protein
MATFIPEVTDLIASDAEHHLAWGMFIVVILLVTQRFHIRTLAFKWFYSSIFQSALEFRRYTAVTPTLPSCFMALMSSAPQLNSLRVASVSNPSIGGASFRRAGGKADCFT